MYGIVLRCMVCYRDIISSGKEIPQLRLFVCALIEDLSRMTYSDFTGILKSHKGRLLGGKSRWRFGLSDCSLKYN